MFISGVTVTLPRIQPHLLNCPLRKHTSDEYSSQEIVETGSLTGESLEEGKFVDIKFTTSVLLMFIGTIWTISDCKQVSNDSGGGLQRMSPMRLVRPISR